MKNKQERNQLRFPSFGRKYFPLFRGVRGVFILTIFLATLTLTACKKYPEGPLISLRSAWNRITADWEITGFYVNDANETSAVSEIKDIDIFSENIHRNNKHCVFEYKKNIDSIMTFGVLPSLTDNNKVLHIEYYTSQSSYKVSQNSPLNIIFKDASPTTQYQYFINYQLDFRIKKLRYKTMVLERTADGKTYRLELKKIKDEI